jgi:hypothetical protein
MKRHLLYLLLVFLSVQGIAVAGNGGNDVIGGEGKVLPNWDAKVYPNPNNGIFNVMVNGSSAALDLLVFNVIGEKVFELQILGDRGAKINLSGLHKGMYVIQIIDKNRGETVTRRMHVE